MHPVHDQCIPAHQVFWMGGSAGWEVVVDWPAGWEVVVDWSAGWEVVDWSAGWEEVVDWSPAG